MSQYLVSEIESATCMNEEVKGSYSNLWSPDESSKVVSDVDEQLLLCINYRQAFKLTEMSIGKYELRDTNSISLFDYIIDVFFAFRTT